MATSTFIKSLENVQRMTTPWEYFSLANVLTDAQINEIATAKIRRDGILHDGTRSGYIDGEAKQNHQLREYITKENVHKYPELHKLILELQSKEARTLIASMVGNTNLFEGAYVRLEVLHDTKGFYLKPHCDIPEKLISSLLYINNTNENINLGTDLYDTYNEKPVVTVPFEHNTGYIFHGDEKWHGMEKGKEIKVERRGLQINYVTFATDWKV